jgi:hypothetical protein
MGVMKVLYPPFFFHHAWLTCTGHLTDKQTIFRTLKSSDVDTIKILRASLPFSPPCSSTILPRKELPLHLFSQHTQCSGDLLFNLRGQLPKPNALTRILLKNGVQRQELMHLPLETPTML